MNQQPIIALDFPNEQEVMAFLNRFQGEALSVKIGMELFYQNGFHLLDKIRTMGHQIFLDLKLHDIPNTVQMAMKGLAQFDVQMVNVHAAGGSVMMQAAREGLEQGAQGSQATKLIAVTQLTSTNPIIGVKEQQLAVSLADSALHYAQLTKASGLDGVVCSALESKQIELACGKDFLKVTPGIRMLANPTDDQKRIATPKIARMNGATHIVVGRPITKALDPVKAYQDILLNWEEGK
ncbi:orotidine-5'-phosphate decarboxylase [Granulicatella balaenopterae]|uniref:Orotidine 5'-phosphate decarboxylase n=1 Tax=Granulicatella balaenopterae TaxID=137733 RepID=A0A1H9MEF3_9LACT|nr:orotidine-5'-phosphate decarboxylase [Granulicatella balaenopterae]SER22086.1 orotidine-5'-phosphate decarboxylase [Granulicatella balaenopterae]